MVKTSRLPLLGLAFALVVPIVACDSAGNSSKPTIDTTTPAKVPSAPTTNTVAPTPPVR